ncbi:IS3 family transposase, partial [Escherichia coli]
WKGWAILLRQKQKKLIMLPSETMIWQPEFTDKILSRKPGAVQAEAEKAYYASIGNDDLAA